MKRGLALLMGAFLVSGAGSAAAQDDDGDSFSVLADVLVSPDSGHRPELDTGYGLDLRLGSIVTESLGYEFRGFYSTRQPEDTAEDDGDHAGLGADGLYRFPELWTITPYGVAGLGFVYNSHRRSNDRFALMLNAGAGLLSAPLLDVFGMPMRARLEARYHFETHRDSLADVHALLGVQLGFGAPALPEPEPEPVQVVEPEPGPQALGPLDGDRDGVTDALDRCPNTPAGARVDAEGCQILKVLTLKGVNFELNSDQLRPESLPILDQAAAQLTEEFPGARIEVAGHTDSSGSDSYNQNLSMRRANAVRIYLIDAGVEGDRLSAVGYGEIEPVADNDTAEGRAENRRVELRVKEGASR